MTMLERSEPPKKRGEPRKNGVNLERGRAAAVIDFLLHNSGLTTNTDKNAQRDAVFLILIGVCIDTQLFSLLDGLGSILYIKFLIDILKMRFDRTQRDK